MWKLKLACAACVATLGLGGCATPKVVESEQVGDSQLSCAQINAELREAARFEEAARKDRGVTGTNVAAAVFFWPALIGTYANTQEAIDAAKSRKEHLSQLHRDKNCS